MGAKRFLIAGLLAAAVTPPAMAQFDGIDDEISNFGMWTSLGVEKKINKKWSVEFEGELRTADAFNEVSRYSFGLSTSYKICSWLKADVGYTLLRDYTRESNTLQFKDTEEDYSYYEIDNDEDFWRTRHRFNVSFTGSVKFGRLKISLRERWQYTYQPKVSYTKTEIDVTRYNMDDWGWAAESMGLVEYNGYLWQIGNEPTIKEKTKRGKGSNVLRSRLEVSYDIKSLSLEPYISCEMYHDDGGLRKTRYTIGGDYKITKRHSIGLYYRYQDFSGSDEGESTNIIGIGYKFKF